MLSHISHIKLIKPIILLSIVSALIFSCAKVKHPEGGPKDEVAPMLISSNPSHGQISFDGQEIVLVFDKEIEVKGLNKIKISPDVATEEERGFSCQARKNTITLKFDKKLRDNTTYTVNFSDAVVSYSEGIPVENLIISFSTGIEIDEMQASGVIIDLLTKLPVAKAFILLYRCDDETKMMNLIENEPNYFIKTDKEGNFCITNIKKGKYRIYASLNSTDRPKLDYEIDKYGTIVDPIDLHLESISGLIIPIVNSNITELKVLKTNIRGLHVEILLNKPIEEYNLDIELTTNLSEDKKSIYIYNVLSHNQTENKTFSVNLYAKDNVHNVINQQIEISLDNEKTTKIRSYFRISPNSESSIAETGKFTIFSSKPMKDLDSVKADGIMLYLNEKPIFLNIENLEMNNSKDELYISYNLNNIINHEENIPIPLILRISEQTLVDIDDNTNKEIINNYIIKNPKKYGTVSGNIYAANTDNYKIQLVTLDGKVVDEIESSNLHDHMYKFHLVEPGKYFIRILCYSGLNTFWSTGNELKNIPTDPVHINNTPIEVLPNWDIQDIDFSL